jgi:hypothetical protein
MCVISPEDSIPLPSRTENDETKYQKVREVAGFLFEYYLVLLCLLVEDVRTQKSLIDMDFEKRVELMRIIRNQVIALGFAIGSEDETREFCKAQEAGAPLLEHPGK